MNRRLARFAGLVAAAAVALPLAFSLPPTGASGQAAVQAQVREADGVRITIYRHAFIRPDELAILDAIAANPEARAMLLGPAGDFAALALAPNDGLMQGGGVAASAQAVAQLPDLASARNRALELCDAARRGGDSCVVVLEVAPLRQ